MPKVTASFWLIKLLAVTVGETAADYLSVNLGCGLPLTSWIMSAALAVALVLQFSRRRYIPATYWFAVVLISIVGTLVTDNLTDNFEVRLEITTIVCSIALAVTFGAPVPDPADPIDLHDLYVPPGSLLLDGDLADFGPGQGRRRSGRRSVRDRISVYRFPVRRH